MMTRSLSFVVAILLPLGAAAQTLQRRPFVRAVGEGVVSVRPDMARVSVTVLNQAKTAEEAASENARLTASVWDALRKVLGANAQLQTTSYHLSPQYTYPRDGGTPTLTGFVANHTTEATVNDLTLIGRVIDAAVAGGASRIDGVHLMVKDEEPVRAQALRQAGQKARAKADAIAAGLNAKAGPLISAEEGFVSRVIPLERTAMAGAAAATQIEPGQLEVRATVTAEFELMP